MLLREMQEEDLDEIERLEGLLFSPAWSKEDFLHELKTNDYAHYYVLVDDKIVGYAGFWYAYESCELTTIGIDPNYQGKGFSKVLMDYGLKEGHNKGCINYSLEVRVSNERAICLYKKYGYEICAIRKDYYADHKDAYLMVRKEKK